MGERRLNNHVINILNIPFKIVKVRSKVNFVGFGNLSSKIIHLENFKAENISKRLFGTEF